MTILRLVEEQKNSVFSDSHADSLAPTFGRGAIARIDRYGVKAIVGLRPSFFDPGTLGRTWGTRRLPPTRLGLLWFQGEELQVDGVAHGFVAGIVGMEVVAWVVAGQEGVGVIRVADRGLEVDEAIQGTAGPNPVIYGLADRFSVFGVVARAVIGG